MQCSRNRAATLGLLLAIGLLSCRPSTLREPDVIPVPPRLTESQVKEAIGLAIAQPPRPGQTARWYVESEESGVIIAGYQQQGYYLQTAIRYDNREIRVEIRRSKNLLQYRKRIHKAVYVWIFELDLKIRVELGKFAIQSE